MQNALKHLLDDQSLHNTWSRLKSWKCIKYFIGFFCCHCIRQHIVCVEGQHDRIPFKRRPSFGIYLENCWKAQPACSPCSVLNINKMNPGADSQSVQHCAAWSLLPSDLPCHFQLPHYGCEKPGIVQTLSIFLLFPSWLASSDFVSTFDNDRNFRLELI